MKHIKPRGYTESRASGDGIHRYDVVVGEKAHYCKRVSSCDQCDKNVRVWCKVISWIEKRQDQIISDKKLNSNA